MENAEYWRIMHYRLWSASLPSLVFCNYIRTIRLQLKLLQTHLEREEIHLTELYSKL